MKQSIAVLIAITFVLTARYATVGAQTATKSVKDGVYTEAQAKRGQELYSANCAACHGDDLNGGGPMPPLTGPDFLANWKTVGDIFEKTHTSMPASAPGTLDEQQTSDIIAYMLSVEKFPAGDTELAPSQEPLMQITIDMP